ncbi:Ribonuclease P protein component 1 [Thermoplasmatales archaeon]|nr:Ribonuclease P protein component 1 [Thermoplasmatales archaeon]
MREENLVYFSELIGHGISIRKSTNPTMNGKYGTVVDETKKTIIINDGKKNLVIPKENCNFEINYGEKRLEISGRVIAFRPEDRLKEHRKIERMIRKGGN